MRWMLTLVMISLPALAGAQEAPALTTDKDKLSYAMGMDLGDQLKTRSVDIDPAVFGQGLKDALVGRQDAPDRGRGQGSHHRAAEGDAGQAGRARPRSPARRTRQRAKRFSPPTSRRKASSPSRAASSTRSYRRHGQKPTLDDTVVCHYRGHASSTATEFDSSYKRGNPPTFPVKGVIKGWTEVLQLMPVGSKWQVFIPSTLAYGERGAGAVIGPNATLIFEIELVAIK